MIKIHPDLKTLPVLLILLGLLIYSQWGRWGNWLWEMGGILLSLAFACGLVCMSIFSLLYFGERKKSERLEQEIARLRYLNAQITYLDEKGEPCIKEQAVKVSIIEALTDGSHCSERRQACGLWRRFRELNIYGWAKD
jgi:hypothetical protein